MKTIKTNLPLISATILSLAAVIMFLTQGLTLPLGLVVAVATALGVFGREKKCSKFVVWQQDFSVGIPSIDDDHKKLLNLINNVQAAVMCDTGEEFERSALKELLDYTQYHFDREEELMRQFKYKDYEAHKGQHEQMIIQAKVFADRYNQHGRDALAEVADYLRLWLLQHINGTDKKYSADLIAKGAV